MSSRITYGRNRLDKLNRPVGRKPPPQPVLSSSPGLPVLKNTIQLPFWQAASWDFAKPTTPASNGLIVDLDRDCNKVTAWIVGLTNGGWTPDSSFGLRHKAGITFFHREISSDGFRWPINFNNWFGYAGTSVATGAFPLTGDLGSSIAVNKWTGTAEVPNNLWLTETFKWSFTPRTSNKIPYSTTEEHSLGANDNAVGSMHFTAMVSGNEGIARMTVFPVVIQGFPINRLRVNIEPWSTDNIEPAGGLWAFGAAAFLCEKI